jgi:hypothetical protein
MPKSDRNATNGVKKPDGALPSFVRCELSESNRDVVRKGILTPEVALDFIESLCLQGVKVSLSYEVQNDAFGVYATGGQVSRPEFKGLCLTARGPDAIGAVTALNFKHSELLGGDWRTAQAWSKDEKWS